MDLGCFDMGCIETPRKDASSEKESSSSTTTTSSGSSNSSDSVMATSKIGKVLSFYSSVFKKRKTKQTTVFLDIFFVGSCVWLYLLKFLESVICSFFFILFCPVCKPWQGRIPYLISILLWVWGICLPFYLGF